MKGLSPVSVSNLRLLSQIIGTFDLSTWAQPLWSSQKVSVSALAEPLAQMLRLVGSGLKFCKQSLKYGYHSSFSTSKFQMATSTWYKYIKKLPKVVFGCFYMFTRFSIVK